MTAGQRTLFWISIVLGMIGIVYYLVRASMDPSALLRLVPTAGRSIALIGIASAQYIRTKNERTANIIFMISAGLFIIATVASIASDMLKN